MYDNPNAGHSNVLAFFELSNSPHMSRHSNTPEWVRHIAFALGEYDEFLVCKTHLEKNGVDVLGPVDHGLFDSIYFFAPGARVKRWPMRCWKNGAARKRRPGRLPGCIPNRSRTHERDARPGTS